MPRMVRGSTCRQWRRAIIIGTLAVSHHRLWDCATTPRCSQRSRLCHTPAWTRLRCQWRLWMASWVTVQLSTSVIPTVCATRAQRETQCTLAKLRSIIRNWWRRKHIDSEKRQLSPPGGHTNQKQNGCLRHIRYFKKILVSSNTGVYDTPHESTWRVKNL